MAAISAQRTKFADAELEKLKEADRTSRAEIGTLKGQLKQLAGDFKHNLQLLKDRDTELDLLENQVAAHKATEARQSEVCGAPRTAASCTNVSQEAFGVCAVLTAWVARRARVIEQASVQEIAELKEALASLEARAEAAEARAKTAETAVEVHRRRYEEDLARLQAAHAEALRRAEDAAAAAHDKLQQHIAVAADVRCGLACAALWAAAGVLAPPLCQCRDCSR